MTTEAPFKIRGHHLENFALINNGVFTPEALVLTRMKLDQADAESDPGQLEYYVDLYGSTEQEISNTISRRINAYSQLLELPPEFPVTITNGEPDEVCASCTVGNHCKPDGSEFAINVDGQVRQVYESQIEDMYAISKFVMTAVKLTIEGRLPLESGSIRAAEPSHTKPTESATPVLEISGFSYQDPILTSAGLTRAVLSHWGYASAQV